MNTIRLQPIDETSISTVAVARCADGNGTLTPLFFSDHVLDIARAKAICARCALREECLRDALERAEPWGVWGGELLSGGRIVADKRPGGRPPKRPRPPVVVDELGIVDDTWDDPWGDGPVEATEDAGLPADDDRIGIHS